ncbi:unnamed protein product [Fraxinus pennsylvanica]|uniref:Uncharacterized protein n=1 Tax=Fraxinus pennsylvanica TaxID=56036 RepID=A0AAD2DXY1_9LAMI|nr:unnamed protein product [Fraxinus pennsylvanica]
MGDYTVKVEEGRVADNGNPSAGAVYRCIYAKDGLMEIPPGFESPWDFFRFNPDIVNMALFSFVYNVPSLTTVNRFPKNPVLGRRLIADGKAGPYAWLTYHECPEWIIAIEAWCCLRVGANAVEYIINHAEVSIAFVQESKWIALINCTVKPKEQRHKEHHQIDQSF